MIAASSTPIARVDVGDMFDLPDGRVPLAAIQAVPVEIPANGGALFGPITTGERLASHYVKLSL
jgi:hypothetical protein